VIDSIPQKSPGDGKSDTIEPQEAVLVSFEGRMAVDRTVRSGLLFQKVDKWLVVVGDADVLPALEMVRKTKIRFCFFCGDYFFHVKTHDVVFEDVRQYLSHLIDRPSLRLFFDLAVTIVV